MSSKEHQEVHHTASHATQTKWRLTEDLHSHAQGKPRTPLRTASIRLCTMENGLSKSIMSSDRTVEPGGPPSETWSIIVDSKVNIAESWLLECLQQSTILSPGAEWKTLANTMHLYNSLSRLDAGTALKN